MPSYPEIMRTGFAVFLIFALLSPVTAIQAQPFPLWGGLQPGEYTVGFKTIEKYDFSRTYRYKYDADGNLRSGERARPIQVCIWYPAKKAASASQMVYAEYAFPNPDDIRFFGLLSRLQERQIYNELFPLVQNNYDRVQDLMSITMAAVRNAPPLKGPFPVIIYYPDT
ncbi:MAG: hypothetical protein JSV44_00800, partial [Candidatus Zixiibacteriota bacterium]